jgi:hypothetical protein
VRSIKRLINGNDMKMKDALNSVVIRYALNSITDKELTRVTAFNRQFIPTILNMFRGIPNMQFSEAVVRTQGLSYGFVVASCSIQGRGIAYSDFSGKKSREAILNDFPHRRHDFTNWYHGNSKPYQHIDFYNRIIERLGKIGGFTQNVNHPIGYCAEQNVANRLLLDADDNIDSIQFSAAIRPRTGEFPDYCGNCRALFNV